MFNIEMYADGANLDEIRGFRNNELVSGFTTNPTLMRNAGVKDYLKFAVEAARIADPLPISFEVFADDLKEMLRQAIILNRIRQNVFVKIPITNTLGVSTRDLVIELNSLGIRVNVTAIMTQNQLYDMSRHLDKGAQNIFSVFAGRIADTGIDPKPIMIESKEILKTLPNSKLLWASPREIYNLVQAEKIGVDIITMTSDLWKKLTGLGKDLTEFSLETVKMFYNDAIESGYKV